MKFKLKSKEGRGEFHGFILNAVDLDDAANKLYKLKGIAEYPTLDDYTIEEYIETRGKPPIFEKSSIRQFREDDSVWDKIPGNKSKFIRAAIREKLRVES